MSGLAIQSRYMHLHPHGGGFGAFCPYCALVQVLIDIEGFQDETADLDAGNRVHDAIRGAAFRSYISGIRDGAGRAWADSVSDALKRMEEIP